MRQHRLWDGTPYSAPGLPPGTRPPVDAAAAVIAHAVPLPDVDAMLESGSVLAGRYVAAPAALERSRLFDFPAGLPDLAVFVCIHGLSAIHLVNVRRAPPFDVDRTEGAAAAVRRRQQPWHDQKATVTPLYCVLGRSGPAGCWVRDPERRWNSPETPANGAELCELLEIDHGAVLKAMGPPHLRVVGGRRPPAPS